MMIIPLDNNHVKSTADCIHNVINPLPFYSEFAKEQEINKFTTENLAKYVDNQSRCNLIIVHNDTVVGFLLGVVDANVLFVSWIGVMSEYHRNGYMRELWNAMEAWCKEQGVHRVWCDTNQLNVPAILFMRKMGMERCGELENFWYGHDYFLWEKSLV